MSRYANARAFTLLELIITLAIVAILLVIATPSFTNFAQKRTVSQKTVELRGALQLARGLAISQQQMRLASCMLKSSPSKLEFSSTQGVGS